MAQYSVDVRNARLDAIETEIGTAPILRIRTGAEPANCAAADTGTVLVEMTLPTDWMAAASSGTKAMLGSWSATASATGTAAHFRIYDSGDTACHMQGDVTATSGGGDMEIDSTSVTSGNTVAVSAFTITAGNA